MMSETGGTTQGASGSEASKAGMRTFRVHLKGFEAVILYPALVTPAIVAKDDGCLMVILATKDDFFTKIYQVNKEGTDEIGEITARKLHSQLLLTKWGNKAIVGVADWQHLAHFRDLAGYKNMIYSDHMKAVEKYKSKDYRGWYLGALQDNKDFLVKGYDEDGNPGRLFGVLHHGAAKMYLDVKDAKGFKDPYKHLFQLNFKKFDNVTAAGLYELAFVYFQLAEDGQSEEEAKTDEKDFGKAAEDGGEAVDTEVKAPSAAICEYTHSDDDVINNYFANDDVDKRPELLRNPVQIEAKKLVGVEKIFKLYESAGKTVTIKRPASSGSQDNNGTEKKEDEYQIPYTLNTKGPFLQSRHPVYIPDDPAPADAESEEGGSGKAWRGRVGVMGDLHVSSRQTLFPLVKAQVIPGADEKLSPFIGAISHNNLESADSLLETIGKDCDVLALVGDLYDHTINCDPNHFVADESKTSETKSGATADTRPGGQAQQAKMTLKTTGDLWNAMAYNKQYKDKDYNTYPRCIDGLLMLSRIIDFYGKHERPVIYVSGNHEGYEHPFGISPRLAQDTINMRLNSGICADHNLTFYEGALLYGEESDTKGMDAEKWHLVRGKAFNYRPENFDWLYCLFSPWQDFVISYGKGKSAYNFICLGWEKEEAFVASATVRTGGSLPRAQTACTDDQLALTQWAVKTKSENNILLSHFTFVSYDRELPFEGGEKATVDTQNHGPVGKATLGKHDIGSFYEHRSEMYDFLLKKEIAYSICGHSHRPAVYTFGQTGRYATWKGNIPVSATVGDGEMVNSVRSGSTTPCLVCGSAGPFSHQNLKGELGGYGMDYPQGFILDVKDGTLTWVKDKKAKPRFAVVMDYLWYDGGTPPFAPIVSPLTPEEAEAYMKSGGSGVSVPLAIPRRGLLRADDGRLFFILSQQFKAVLEKSEVFRQSAFTGLTHPFNAITLVAVCRKGDTDSTVTLAMTPSDWETAFTRSGKQYSGFDLGVDSGKLEALKQDIKKKSDNLKAMAHFLSIQFKIAGPSKGFDYDLNSPWCFPVDVSGDYDVIYRPEGTKGGELPNWKKFYAIKWPDEYPQKSNQ